VPNPRFYIDFPLGQACVGTSLALPGDVAHHAVRVLRLPLGAPIRLFDGRGGEYRAAIDRIDRHGVGARVDRFDPVDREWAGAPVLALAVIATDPMDAAVRKAVELGAASIVPVVAARSQGAMRGARGTKRLQHWRSIAIAACEQCGRNRVPPIAEPVALDDGLRGIGPANLPGAIAGPGATVSLAGFASRTPPRTVLVGPEGGFTEAEVTLAVARGFVPVHLGARVLRADTAAVAALATLAAVAGDAR
jgi:16S rRNA (uracil1498-N3)-methyltransferase